MDINPWQVESIQDFSFLKCPECTFDTKEEDTFQDHATENHPLSFALFKKTLKDECFEHLYTIEEHNLDIEDSSDNETKPENFLLSTMMVEESSNKPKDSESHLDQVQVSSDHEPKTKDKNYLKKRGRESGAKSKSGLKTRTESAHERKKYNCEKYEETLSQKIALYKHIDNIHDGDDLGSDENKDGENISGNLLFKSSDSPDELSITGKSDNSEEVKPLKCSLEPCKISIFDENDLANHSENTHEHVKPKKENIADSSTCSICGKRFVSDNYLNKHVSTVHKKIKTFKCQIDSCLSRYVDKRGLKKHMEKVHSVLPEKKKPFNCSTCDYVGKSKLQLKLHIDDVHEGKKLKPLLCTICGWRCTWPAALKFHTQNVHEGKKSHLCTTCSKGFGTSFHLNEHISTVHEKIKSHQCPVCGKKFGVKQNLDNHIRGVHDKNKPHKCTFCEYACTNRSQLQNHLKEVHEEIKSFACSICNSKFGLKFRLVRHIKEVHEKKNRQTCSLCNSTFSHIGNLNAHIASVHEGKKSKKNQKKNQPVVE